MAFPLLKSLEDCADFKKTVEPFIPQLYDIHLRVRDVLGNAEAFKQLYITTNPLISGFAFSVFLGFIFLVLSEWNRNYSQVDRMWSILPNFYILHLTAWAMAVGLPHERLLLISAFSTIWSVCI